MFDGGVGEEGSFSTVEIVVNGVMTGCGGRGGVLVMGIAGSLPLMESQGSYVASAISA